MEVDSSILGDYPHLQRSGGSGAAKPSKPRQVREEAAAQRTLRVMPGSRPERDTLWYTDAAMKLDRKYIAPVLRVSAVVLTIAGILLLYKSNEKTYYILDDEVEVTVQSNAKIVHSILNKAGIRLGENDVVLPGSDQVVADEGLITIQRSQPFLFSSGAEFSQVSSVANSLSEFLEDMGQRPFPGDQVWLDGVPTKDFTQIFKIPPRSIKFEGSNSIKLIIDGEETEIHSTAATLGGALMEVGIYLRVGDELTPGPESPLDGLTEVVLHRALPITIHADGTVYQTRIVADDVGTALSKAGIPLIGRDYSVPAKDDDLPRDGAIHVVRVQEQVVIEQEPIPFETGYQLTPDLEIDQQSIINPGSYGVRARRVRITFEDGHEVSRSTEGEWVAREPDQRIIGYGTNIVIRTMDTPHGQISYWRAIRMYATSYSPSRAGVPDDWPWWGKTACGKDLVKGLVAIDNHYIPFHTMMYVPGYGFAEACDIGGGVKGRWIDLGYEDHNWENWHEYVTVYFLTPVPPSNSIAWIFP